MFLAEIHLYERLYQASGLRCGGLHILPPGHAPIGQVALIKQSQELELVIRVFAATFAQMSFSILLDTHTL
jgi:hypothetical protein